MKIHHSKRLLHLFAIPLFLASNIINATPLDDLIKKADQPKPAQQALPEKTEDKITPYTTEEFFAALPMDMFSGYHRSQMRNEYITGKNIKYTEFEKSISSFDYGKLKALKEKTNTTNYNGNAYAIDPIWGGFGDPINFEFYKVTRKYVSDPNPESETELAKFLKNANDYYNSGGRSASNGKVFLNDIVSHLQKIVTDYKTLVQRESDLYKPINDAIDASNNQANEKFKNQSKCMQTSAYALYKLTNDIANTNKSIQYNQSAIDRQNEIGRATGFVDKSIMYTAGQNLVSEKKFASESFAKYKALGGNAGNYQSVNYGKDPCN